MSVIKTVTIRPESSILAVLSRLNYEPWFALAEYVDNAVQSAIAQRLLLTSVHMGRYQLRVQIVLDHAGGRIIVRDNAAGISEPDFPRAFQAAYAPPDTSGLSEFGMGMKSASCWFARRWHVRTSAVGEEIARTVTFDMAEVVRTKVESLSVVETPAPLNQHFTEIVLEDLNRNVKTRTLGKCKDHLASIYRRFIADGTLVLEFDGARLEHDYPEFLVEPEWHAEGVLPPAGADALLWKKDLDFVFADHCRAKGFAGLRKEGKPSQNGLSLFRRNRLIVGTAAEPYRPAPVYGQPNSYESQRVFIELELHGAAVSHTKDGFRLSPDEEDELFAKLRTKLNEPPLRLVRQANNYRHLKRLAEASQAALVDGVAASTGTVFVGPVRAEIEDQITSPPTDYAPPQLLEEAPMPPLNAKTIELDFEGAAWRIDIQLNPDPSQGELVDVSESLDGGVRTVSIRLALAHPYVQRHLGPSCENLQPIYHMAAALGVSEVTSRLVAPDNQAARMRVFFGRILDKLSQKP